MRRTPRHDRFIEGHCGQAIDARGVWWRDALRPDHVIDEVEPGDCDVRRQRVCRLILAGLARVREQDALDGCHDEPELPDARPHGSFLSNETDQDDHRILTPAAPHAWQGVGA